MGVEVFGIGRDGSAVGGFRGGGLGGSFGERVLGESEIVEQMRVVGGFFGEGGEELEGSGVVLLFEGFIGLVEDRIGFLNLGLSGVDRAGWELGMGWNRHAEKRGEYERWNEAGTAEGMARWLQIGRSCVLHLWYPLLSQSAQSIQTKHFNAVLGLGVKS